MLQLLFHDLNEELLTRCVVFSVDKNEDYPLARKICFLLPQKKAQIKFWFQQQWKEIYLMFSIQSLLFLVAFIVFKLS